MNRSRIENADEDRIDECKNQILDERSRRRQEVAFEDAMGNQGLWIDLDHNGIQVPKGDRDCKGRRIQLRVRRIAGAIKKKERDGFSDQEDGISLVKSAIG